MGIVLATADLQEDLQVLLAFVNKPGADKEYAELLSAIAQSIPIVIKRRNGTQSVLIAEDQQFLVPLIHEGINARAVVDERGELRRLPLAR